MQPDLDEKQVTSESDVFPSEEIRTGTIISLLNTTNIQLQHLGVGDTAHSKEHLSSAVNSASSTKAFRTPFPYPLRAPNRVYGKEVEKSDPSGTHRPVKFLKGMQHSCMSQEYRTFRFNRCACFYLSFFHTGSLEALNQQPEVMAPLRSVCAVGQRNEDAMPRRKYVMTPFRLEDIKRTRPGAPRVPRTPSIRQTSVSKILDFLYLGQSTSLFKYGQHISGSIESA